jgi:transposase InsO family protein
MDNGGEYVNKYVEHICSEAGIQLQHTIPYTPQQNRVAERKNWSLKEMANCMLHARSLPSKLWVEAINCATYSFKILHAFQEQHATASLPLPEVDLRDDSSCHLDQISEFDSDVHEHASVDLDPRPLWAQ